MHPDFRLLKIFDAVYKAGGVSRAADRLGVTQPSVSIALAKLRRHFNDALFVRTSLGLKPTPYASELAASVDSGLQHLEAALRHQAKFDVAASTRVFRLCVTDISQAVLIPSLLNHLKRVGPLTEVEVLPISEQTPKLLETGEADIAVGFMPQLEAGFFQQVLFQQHFVCAVREGHPRIKDRITRKQYLKERHVAVSTPATGHRMMDEALERAKLPRRIALRLTGFLGLSAIIAQTDLIATVPERLGEAMQRETPRIKLMPTPVPLPRYAVKQHWHARYHHEPANKWLRTTMAELFAQ